MSQDASSKARGEGDINRMVFENGDQKNYEGFEGMNYEQLRQPYNPNNRSRNRSTDERKDAKRPDEG